MEGLDGHQLLQLNHQWTKFRSEIMKGFKPQEGAILAKQEMDNVKYKDDISKYIEKMRSLNHRVGMSGVTLHSTIQMATPQEICYQLLYSPKTNNNDDWMSMVVEIGRMLELGK